MQTLLLLLFTIACVQGQSKLVQWFTLVKARTVETQFPTFYHEWLVFKKAHGKVYGEINTEQRRYEIFKDNLQYIEDHNKLYRLGQKSFYLGINEYADMTHEEFKRYMHLDKLMKPPSEEASTFIPPFFVQAPDEVDWRTKGFVTPVKNQGHCGSCWAFSTTGSMEGLHFKKTGKLVSLSEQQLVDCTSAYQEKGCKGGYANFAFMYIKEKGLESETSYKYKAKQYSCSYDKSAVVAKCSGYKDVKHFNESNLKLAVATQGPVSAGIDAYHLSFRFYKGGVYNQPNCSTLGLDHAVLVVGYGTNKTTGDDYWIVKNSWGTTWGMDGYIMMSRNKKNQCGIATKATFPI